MTPCIIALGEISNRIHLFYNFILLVFSEYETHSFTEKKTVHIQLSRPYSAITNTFTFKTIFSHQDHIHIQDHFCLQHYFQPLTHPPIKTTSNHQDHIQLLIRHSHSIPRITFKTPFTFKATFSHQDHIQPSRLHSPIKITFTFKTTFSSQDYIQLSRPHPPIRTTFTFQTTFSHCI